MYRNSLRCFVLKSWQPLYMFFVAKADRIRKKLSDFVTNSEDLLGIYSCQIKNHECRNKTIKLHNLKMSKIILKLCTNSITLIVLVSTINSVLKSSIFKKYLLTQLFLKRHPSNIHYLLWWRASKWNNGRLYYGWSVSLLNKRLP